MSRTPSDLRHRALAAALLIATRDGAASLTLDAVAKEAAISKGGLMHHFPSKDALVLALVEKLVFEFEGMVLARADMDPEPIGRYVRAFMDAMESPELATLGRALLAAVALNSALLEPLRASHRRCLKRIETDGLPAVIACQCALFADALWFGAIFDLPRPQEASLGALRKSLRDATHAVAPKPSATS